MIKNRAIFGLVVVSLFISACVVSSRGRFDPLPPTVPPELAYLTSFMLDGADIPSRWYDDGEVFVENKPGAQALSRDFEVTTDPDRRALGLRQDLLLYPDTNSALDAYSSKLEMFRQQADVWYVPNKLTYQSDADAYTFMCSNAQIGWTREKYMLCSVFQVHGRAFSWISAGIDGNFITLEEVEAVLARADEKLTEFTRQDVVPTGTPDSP